MDFAVAIDNRTGTGRMTFERATTLMNNIYLSLMVRRGSFFADPGFGSRLHLLQRAKNTDMTARLAMDYCREALQWMIDEGRVKTVEVYAERDRTRDINRLKLLVEVTPVNRDAPVPFAIFIEVV